MSSHLQQSLGESEVFDLVCDYLRTRQFYKAEETLRSEREHVAKQSDSETQRANPQPSAVAEESTSLLSSRLESMLERSYVTQFISGDTEEPEKVFVPRHEVEELKQPARTNLDGNESLQTTEANVNEAEDEKELSVSTRLVSFEACKDDPHGSSSMPIYQTSTFAQPSATNFGEYDYSRSGNPTRAALERQMAELEFGHRSFAFSSGMSALSAVSRLAKSGEEIILSDDSYGGTYRLLSKVVQNQGVSIKYVDLSGTQGPKNLSQALSPKTKLVMMESPTNPLQRVCDIAGLAAAAHANGTLLSIDNTMMSPINQNPLPLGADIVVHSATKFVGGHSDTMSGIVIAKDVELCKELYFFQNAEGTGLAPFDCWLLLRGVKTMGLRVNQAQQNCMQVAEFLRDHPAIQQVMYTGLLSETDENRQIHDRQSRGFGSVLAFRPGSLEFAQHIVSETKLFKITVSFGSVNSLISLPGVMSHASIPEEVRKARDFPVDLVRLSIGVEDVKDLIRDLSQAFQSYVPKDE